VKIAVMRWTVETLSPPHGDHGGLGVACPKPYLPNRPGNDKRVKAAAALICRATEYLATLCPSWTDDLRLFDAAPVPWGTSRQTVRRPELAELAGNGYCDLALALVLGVQALSAHPQSRGCLWRGAWPTPSSANARVAQESLV
jgi:hypothetical protein